MILVLSRKTSGIVFLKHLLLVDHVAFRNSVMDEEQWCRSSAGPGSGGSRAELYHCTQDRQCTNDEILWHFRVVFTPR